MTTVLERRTTGVEAPQRESVLTQEARRVLEYGPEPENVVNVVSSLVDSASSAYLSGERKAEVQDGFALAEATRTTDKFRRGVERSKKMSRELLQGKEYGWWDIERYKDRMQQVFDVSSEGQFVPVLGRYAMNRVGGEGPIMVVNHQELFPKNDPYFLDALTNATVTNFGQGYSPQLIAANTLNRLTGGAQCVPYHPGPLMEVAAKSLIDVMPIEKKGARVAWFNSGGDAVSVGIAAAEKWVEARRGENGRRKAAFFKEAYHGNIEGRAGRVTGGINQMFHAEDRNSIEFEYPDREDGTQPVLQQLNDLADQNKLSCVVFESTQGDGGGISMHPDFFNELMKLSLDKGVPLVCDEVQSGFGRSGKVFDVEYLLEYWGGSSYVKSGGYPEKPPMIIAVAKSMTNGAASGSAVVFPKEYAVLGRAQGLNTYSALPNTLATTIMTATMMRPEVLEMVQQKREVFDQAIGPYVGPDRFIRETRGHGLHLFMDVSSNQVLQCELLGRKRILTGTVARNGLRIHAPMNAPDEVWQALGKVTGEVAKDLENGKVTPETLKILKKGGPSGLAVR